jgi:hypothetical protein
MNRKLSDEQIIATLQSLRGAGAPVTGRALQAALRARFGAAGKTERVFAHCRALGTAQEPGEPVEPQAGAQWRRQALAAEQAVRAAQSELKLALARAARSEAREVAHQDRWAGEIHSLRETVARLQGERARRQILEDQVLRLQRELQVLRQGLAHPRGPQGPRG